VDQEIAWNEPCTAACVRRNAFHAIAVGAAAQKRAPVVRPLCSAARPRLVKASREIISNFNWLTGHGYSAVEPCRAYFCPEREIAGERIRDKIAASKKKGMWMGGNVPLGYDVKDRKLVVNETEAATVRLIFQRYAELGSVALLKPELDQLGIVSMRREGAMGQLSGGKRFSRGALYLMLQNRFYRGEVAHKGQIYPGQHEAIIESELWQIVQDRLAAGRHERSMAVGAEAPSLLAGLVFDSDGNRMTPTHAVKKGKRYRYYVSTALITGSRTEHPKGWRIPAGDIEGLSRHMGRRRSQAVA
jgi:site-specific DNA recombinase